jgi:RNA polymerase sigma-70 factor, ECF subfamily
MEEPRIQELLDRLNAGDRSAMSALLVAGFDPLRSALLQRMRKVPAASQLEPEDVIQDVYVAAWAALPEARFDSFQSFLGWLRQIAENKLIDIQRANLAEKRDVRRQTPAWGEKSGTYVNLLDCVSSPMSTPSRGAAHSEAIAVLMVQMLELPEDYRRVIHWRLIDGLPVAEVAHRLERSEAAVHMLFHRALKQLRELMGSPSNYLTQK